MHENSPQPDPRLLDLAQASLGAGKSILVTGGTGFVGSQVARVLSLAGHDVTVLGRSRFRAPRFGRFVACDITDAAQVHSACRDQEIVIHAAAWTSPWGSLAKHRRINTQGTENVVVACIKEQVKRLVHISSTAIFFQFRDLEVEDHSPFPARFSCAYAQSKAEAEHIVEEAIERGLNAYILRARAVFGPGDNALLPRLIRAAEEGRLSQIGEGRNLCDLTYIDNLVAGILLAASPSKPTGICTITNEEPVNLWEVLHEVLEATCAGYDRHQRVPVGLASFAARIAQWKHWLLRRRGEPPITRYSVGLLAHQQLFRSSAAKEQLGYRPLVPINEAKQRTITALKSRESCEGVPADGAELTVQFFSTGYIEAPRWLADRSGARHKTRYHATIALITHPQQGHILFDTGYSPRFFEATKRWPYRLYRWATKVHTQQAWSARAWIERMGIDADEVGLILLSHFHADHIGGLRDFPQAEFLALGKAWQQARHRSGIAALQRAILPGLFPESLESRLHTIHDLGTPGIGPLARCHDLFGDGSIRLFDLSGHADGQMGILVRSEQGKLKFLVADAFWSRVEVEQALAPTLPFRLIADNYRAALRTRKLLHQLCQEHPQIEIITTHCPEFSNAQDFDGQLTSAART